MSKVIGRRASALNASVDGESKEFTLDSGETASFELKRIKFDDLVNNSFVDEKVNGREQDGINDTNLSDIVDTINEGQFYSVYVLKDVDGRYEFLDGSRRRKSAIYKKVGLEAFVTNDKMSLSDKIMFAHNLQTAKEHNYREKGIKLKNYMLTTNVEQKEASLKFGYSEATASRLLKAASVSIDLLNVFPDRNSLTLEYYNKLAKVEGFFASQKLDVAHYLSTLCKDIESIHSHALPLKETTELLVNLIVTSIIETPKTKVKPVIKKLVNFSDKNKYAKCITKGDKVSFELKGLPSELIDEVQAFIKNKLQS